MAKGKAENILVAVATVLKEKLALASKERTLVKSLNKVLKKMGYAVVKSPEGPKPGRGTRKRRTSQKSKVSVRRPRTTTGKRRGRPRKTRS